MRGAFTLIEILVIVAIMAVMVTASVVSVRSGQDAARLRGATRDIVAAIRHARTVALVSRSPSSITYSTRESGDDVYADLEVKTEKIINDSVTVAETLQGEIVRLDGEPSESDSAPDRPEVLAGLSAEEPQRGESMEEILFSPISSNVVRGVRIRVVTEEEFELARDGAKRRTSIRWKLFEDGRQISQGSSGTADTADAPEAGDQEPVTVGWEDNGRTKPHRIWVYLDGRDPGSGLSIKVDRFGGIKVLGQDGEEIGK